MRAISARVKDEKNVKDGCNFQIIGDVKAVSGNKWDGGWMIDPDKDPNKKYDVEITPLSDQKRKSWATRASSS